MCLSYPRWENSPSNDETTRINRLKCIMQVNRIKPLDFLDDKLVNSGIEGNPTVFYRLMPGSTAQTNKFHTFYLQQRPDNGDTWADIKIDQTNPTHDTHIEPKCDEHFLRTMSFPPSHLMDRLYQTNM
uniref:Uncharacterized protein n=1 Tax=Glossina austeni TaxID=7395 RepID=A0A1A9UJP1_GLOAU